MTPFAEADRRLSAMHGYEAAKRQEVRCVCGEWHPRTGITMGGVEVIDCPRWAEWSGGSDWLIPGNPEIRDAE